MCVCMFFSCSSCFQSEYLQPRWKMLLHWSLCKKLWWLCKIFFSCTYNVSMLEGNTVFMQLSILGRGKSGRALNKFSAPAVRGNHEQGGEEEGWMDYWAGVGTELGSAARALCLYTSHWPSSSVRSGASALLRQVTDSWASQSHWDCVGYEGVRGCCKEEQQLTFTQHGWAGLEGKLAGAYLKGLLAGLSKCRVVVTSSFQTEDVSTAEKEFWGKAWKEPIYS